MPVTCEAAAMQTLSDRAFAPGWNFDADLLRRHDRPGPRYTSYPTAPQFHEDFGAAQLMAAAARSNASGRPLSLYVHVPFCTSPCFYCGCNRVITRDHSRGEHYVGQLLLEAERMAALFGPCREVVQLHFGGGTPNFLSPAQLRRLMEGLRRLFRFSTSAQRDISIELDPRMITASQVAELGRLGFNRASLGVQDINPGVQEAINRIQPLEQTLEVMTACRQYGLSSVNVDLIYGLPRQTLAGFAQTVELMLEQRPERLAVYGYAHLPHLFRAQRQIDEADLPSAEDKLALLGVAVEKLTAAGYQYIGLDHFALPDDPLAIAQRQGQLHRNFMGYTTHAQTDLVGLGVSAISHIDSSYSQNPRDLAAWEAALAAGGLAVWRGLELTADDQLRAALVQALMCHGEVDMARFEQEHSLVFADYFAADLERLQPLQRDGLARVSDGVIAATQWGRPLLRLLAMCFDPYLHGQGSQQRFSRTI